MAAWLTTQLLHADEPSDTLSLSGSALGEVEVKGVTTAPRVSSLGVIRFSQEALATTPQAFGEADHLRFIKILPGVNVISDYSSGTSIDGMQYSQNAYRLNGIPLHFPYHLGGIFSVANPRLYRDASLSKSIRRGDSYEVLGGEVDLESLHEPVSKASGALSVGMLSSSANVALPTAGGKISVEAAGRISYINLLYKSLLKMDESQARYDFADLDAAINYRASASNTLRTTLHYNRDHVTYDDRLYDLLTSLQWSNMGASLSWRHDGERLAMRHQAYFTRFANRLGLILQSVSLTAPTSISEWGLEGDGTLPAGERLHMSAGYALRLYDILPQGVDLQGFGSTNANTATHRFSSLEKVWGEAQYDLNDNLQLRGEVDVTAYQGNSGYHTAVVDPALTVIHRFGSSSLTLHTARHHQFIHQVGFSEMGMSSNFKVGSNSYVPPQESWNFVVSANSRIANPLTLNVDAYWKRILHDPEYIGAVLDILDPGYVSESFIRSTNGYTWGVNVMTRMEQNLFTAIASYSFGVARRRDYLTGQYRYSPSDLRHSLNLNGMLAFNKHWSLTAAFNYSSGRRITPIKYIYFIANRLMMEYGERNSARLAAYHRLDLGVTYRFTTSGLFTLLHELNFSFINVYGHKNIEMSTFRVNVDQGTYENHQTGSLFRYLPSVSYSIAFR